MSAAIRLLVLDVDGTLTDGAVFLDGAGNEFKRFHVRDGMGIARLRASGVEVAILSGRYSAATARRAGELGIHLLFNGVKNKLPALEELAASLGLAAEEIAYAGDDVNDLQCIRWAGLGCAVADAEDDVRNAARFVSKSRGGYGAVRDIAEHIIRLNGATCGMSAETSGGTGDISTVRSERRE
jgi:3-deoxy-D-manno-octulosonate 8-phosphate phosphatase (KDO 8-P phosphatase)